MSRLRDIGQQLYQGRVQYDFIGRTKRWFVISGVILLVTLASLVFRGLNFGIEFRGGAEFQLPASSCSVEDARSTVGGLVDGGQVIVTQLGNGDLRIQTPPLSDGENERAGAQKGDEISKALAKACDVKADEIKIQVIGPTWGSDISTKALQALIVFLILVTIFLAIYFEWKMAAAALVALAHDLIITIGVYSILGFEVTPATAIGVLTILGYSLYDTVVVFDKVKENTQRITGQSRLTYAEAANLAINQTVMRSINTSVVALLPVAAILFVGAGLLGAGTLKDLALALFVGMAAGTYSSIFIATPFLALLKQRDPEIQALERRVQAKRRKDDDLATVGADAVVKHKNSLTETRQVQETGTRKQPKKQPRSRRKQSDDPDGSA